MEVRIGQRLPEGWDALGGAGDMYASAAWLESQSPGFEELGGVAVTIRSNGTLVAGLPMFPLEDDDSVPASVHPTKLLSRAVPAIDGRRLMPSLLCGGRQSSVTRALTHEAWDRAALLRELVAAAAAHARDRNLASVAFLYVDEHDRAFRHALRDAGFAELRTTHNFILDIDWPDLDAYVASRPGRRRRRLRSELRRLELGGVELETVEAEQVSLDWIVEMTAQRRAKYGKQSDLSSLRTLFERRTRAFGRKAKVFLAKVGGTVAGYTLAFEWRDRMYAWSTGFDYALQGRLPLYFGVTYYAPIAYAAKHGVSAIDYGPTAGEAKVLRGCRSIRQYSYFRATDARVDEWLRNQLASIA